MARLWFGLLAGPLAWLAYLETAYALVDWACAGRHRLPLHAMAALAVAAAMAGAVVARRSLPAAPRDDEDRAVARTRFMALTGVGLSLLSVLLIVAGALPAFVLDPCD